MSAPNPDTAAASPATVTLAVSGSGGNGAVTAGLILLAAAGRVGYYGRMTRSAGPQIRGGESAVMLTLGGAPIRCMGEGFDLLAAVDWGNFGRFSDELPLSSHTLVVADPDAEPVPAGVAAAAGALWLLPLKVLARQHPVGRANMVAVGAVGAMIGLPADALREAAGAVLAGKGARTIEAAQFCIGEGHAQARAHGPTVPLPPTDPDRCCWNISGNEAAGLGALRGGVRFVAAYPITPATELLEWLAPRLPRLGGALLQAEDELASIHMAIGAAFGGVPALTATAGPGLSLMVEGIGLAVASETPVVIVDVMRVGPSTGIATKPEQSDLELALYGLHGDAPHLVLAALDIGDCAFTVDWATRLAERLQAAAIVLSDQSLGQTRALIDPPALAPDLGGRRLAGPPAAPAAGPAPYARYADTPDGVSPMARPGQPGLMYTADGLEHDPYGTPSSRAGDHRAQLDKRRRKLTGFDYGPAWAVIDDGTSGTEEGAGCDPGAGSGERSGPGSPSAPAPGLPESCLITWGSSYGAVMVAAQGLRQRGQCVRVIALRLLAPLQRDALLAAIGDAPVLVIEQNQTGQCFRYLHAERALPAAARSLARPGPLPLRPSEIIAAVNDQRRGSDDR